MSKVIEFINYFNNPTSSLETHKKWILNTQPPTAKNGFKKGINLVMPHLSGGPLGRGGFSLPA